MHSSEVSRKENLQDKVSDNNTALEICKQPSAGNPEPKTLASTHRCCLLQRVINSLNFVSSTCEATGLEFGGCW